MLPIITDLERIAALAEHHRDDDQAFLYYVEILWERENRPDAELDALVETIAAEVIPQIDCTACANCCRGIPIELIPEDLPVMAAALRLPVPEVAARYLQPDPAGWSVFNQVPCPLLDGHLCRIYPHRPRACRDYPPLTPDFRWLAHDLRHGLGICPILFNVFARLKRRLGW